MDLSLRRVIPLAPTPQAEPTDAGSARAWTSRSRLIAAAIVGFLALYLSWQAFRWIPGSKPLVGDILFYPIDVAAIVAALAAARRCGGSRRLQTGWRLIAVTMALYLAAGFIQLYYELHGNRPYPSPADVLNVIFYPVMLAGLLCFPTVKRNRAEGVQLGLDLAIVAIGGATVVWYVVLGPTAIAAGQSLLQTMFSVAYPAGDMILIVGVASLLLREPLESSRRALHLMAAALVVFVVADVIYGYITLHGPYEGGDRIDTLWIVTVLLFLLSALAQRPVTEAVPTVADPDAARQREHASLLPYVAVAAGALLLVLAERHAAFFPQLSVVMSVVALTVLVSVRQLLATRGLERIDRELRAAREELAQLARTDPLTGLPNHRALVDLLDGELERVHRYGGTFGVIFLDIDHFKSINDTLGHAAGDEVLRELAAEIPRSLREVDTLGRWGGEELIAVLPEADTDAAAATAERIRARVAGHRFPAAELTQVTCSLGVASYPLDGAGRDELIGQADRAMYLAKRLGRDQVRRADAPGEVLQPTGGR